MEINPIWQSTSDLLSLRFTTLTASSDGILYAGTEGHGVVQFTPLRSWECASEGLPEGVHVSRLDWVEGQLFASTRLGLYRLEDDVWQQTSVTDSCYRAIGWGDRFVLTENGLLCGNNEDWLPLAYRGKKTYDLLVTPHFIFLGYEDGVAFYDLFTGDWCTMPLPEAVTSLAVFNSMLIGTTESGSVVMGNKKGGFLQHRFEGMFINRLVPHRGSVYACADTGLYKLIEFRGSFMMQALNAQAEVTDLLIWRDMMVISTRESGIKYKHADTTGFQTVL
ncbi:hypothetical protein A8709_15840 [Paenibacillus pectinilyticus]|uniref:Uncharacterized protein n=1 Tax=Paenibacillus pectinilyticus TaxID=512399 RepID=A0A1C1A4T4_9BACL|nr:hypothetical protein [Paenibacillus pectinilyticus]OCT15546.1 hypothetical protein A8709_15840 [Paenibacillus pectinilyticus]